MRAQDCQGHIADCWRSDRPAVLPSVRIVNDYRNYVAGVVYRENHNEAGYVSLESASGLWPLGCARLAPYSYAGNPGICAGPVFHHGL